MMGQLRNNQPGASRCNRVCCGELHTQREGGGYCGRLKADSCGVVWYVSLIVGSIYVALMAAVGKPYIADADSGM